MISSLLKTVPTKKFGLIASSMFVVGYLIYFDYIRRHDPVFREKLGEFLNTHKSFFYMSNIITDLNNAFFFTFKCLLKLIRKREKRNIQTSQESYGRIYT